MPKKLERTLKAGARKAGLTGKRADSYVYGTLNKIESKAMPRTLRHPKRGKK